MTIDIEYETETAFGIDYRAVIERVVPAVLDSEKCPYEAQVSILITDNDAIREINCEQRGIDAPTDVLSFPAAEYDTPADFEMVSGRIDCFHPETGELLLGDIVLSVERVISQAEEYGHSRERELGFLVAHSMLHLIGYDHMEEEERAIMEQRQREILEGIGLKDEDQAKKDTVCGMRFATACGMSFWQLFRLREETGGGDGQCMGETP